MVDEKRMELSKLLSMVRSEKAKLYAIQQEKLKLSETVKTFREVIFVHELKKP